jgi:hypothetical protein
MTTHESDTGERRLLTAMITDAAVLAAVAPHFREGHGLSRWAALIGGWCVAHYARGKAAPGRAIEAAYRKWARSRIGRGDKDSAKFIDLVLGSLSGDYEAQAGRGASLEEAESILSESRWRRLRCDLDQAIDAHDYERAQKAYADFRPVRFGGGDYLDVTDMTAALRDALTAASHPPLLSFHGPKGAFYGRSLDRACFVAYHGPEKRGKSTWLLDLAWLSMLHRRKVAYFESGDMTRPQLLRRLACRATRRPLYACKYRFPVAEKLVGEGKEARLEVSHEVRQTDAVMTLQEAEDAFSDAQENWVRDEMGYLRFQFHPTRALTVPMIEASLEAWASAGWEADVVLVDYADLLGSALITKAFTAQDTIDDTWARMRALSQVRDCLVATATQCKTSAGGKANIGREDIGSYDRRKLAHTTANFVINQTPKEKKLGVTRLDWDAVRDEEGFGTLHCAGCPQIYDPAVRAVLYGGL